MTIETKELGNKVKVLRFKVLVFFILLLVYFVRGFYKEQKIQLETVNNAVSGLERKHNLLLEEEKTIKKQLEYIDLINKNQDSISACSKTKNGETKEAGGPCDYYPQELLGYKDIVRNYMLLTGLNANKMLFDQKTMLYSIIENLLMDENNLFNLYDSINVISFSDPVIIDYKNNLHKLKVLLDVDFKDDKQFLNFIRNVERVINLENRLLFKIQSVNYDIVKHMEKQQVSIVLDAYFYK